MVRGNGRSVMTVSPSQPEARGRAPMAYVVLRTQTKEGVGIDGRSLWNGTAFSAVAPSQRPVYDAHQSKIFESGISIMPRGPNIWTLNIQPLGQFRPHLGFSVSPIHIVQRCGQFATYRPVSCRSALMICRCITACSCGPWSSERYLGHIEGRISWSRCGVCRRDLRQLEIKSKGNGLMPAAAR